VRDRRASEREDEENASERGRERRPSPGRH
jgi:hypothetical protein